MVVNSEKKENVFELPWGDHFEKIVKSIMLALGVCIERQKMGRPLDEEDPDIRACFSWIKETALFQCGHLKDGFVKEREKTKKSPRGPRIVRLVIRSFEDGFQLEEKNFRLPSPLAIACDFLTEPTNPESRAYGLFTARAYLFSKFRYLPDIYGQTKDFKSFNVGEVRRAISTLRNYSDKNDNIPSHSKDKFLDFISHFLALRHFFILRFGSKDKKKLSDEDSIQAAVDYCNSGDINGEGKDIESRPEFRLKHIYVGLPATEDICNDLFGISLPIRGADVLFREGLRLDSDGSLVININGRPGTGKTTAALALANALSPFGTTCYYLSFEEDEESLRSRLHSVTPSYLSSFPFSKDFEASWFFPKRLAENNRIKLATKVEEHLEQIEQVLANVSSAGESNSLPVVCPLMVVIDNVASILDLDGDVALRERLDAFIHKCRQRGSIVVLLSPESFSERSEIDYLVDVVINLELAGTSTRTGKAERVLRLIKTRHQASRLGEHLFEIAGMNGFRIYPQLPMQLDDKQTLAKPLPDSKCIIETLNIGSYASDLFAVRENGGSDAFLDVYCGSSILLHGHGSAGKAGLGLKILLAGIKKLDSDKKQRKGEYLYNRHVLILSFLYPREHYEGIEKVLEKDKEFVDGTKNKETEVLYFYPGYLSPEIFLGKIIRALDAAILQGNSFTGVLIDGLHNVFLQFPRLQENTMVWPQLYNLLGKYRLTVINTFTTFSLEDDGAMSPDDNKIILEGHIPFLHSLVQATDYYLSVEPSLVPGQFDVRVRSSISGFDRKRYLVWDKSRMTLIGTKI